MNKVYGSSIFLMKFVSPKRHTTLEVARWLWYRVHDRRVKWITAHI